MIEMPPILIITIFTFIMAVMLINSIYLLFTERRQRLLDRLQGVRAKQTSYEEEVLNQPIVERVLGPVSNWLKEVSGRLAPQAMQQAVSKRLALAGKYQLRSVDLIAFITIIVALALVSSWVLLSLVELGQQQKILYTLLAGFIVGFLPWFNLGRAATNRQEEIRKKLPDTMDLLVVSVEAGLSFDLSLIKVAERFPGTIGVEFSKTIGEMRMGMSRKDALRGLARRVDIPELNGMVNAVIQSDQLGSSLANVLRLQADLIRTQRQQQIEERAMKAPIKLLFPLIFFIFPSMFVVLLGPAFLSILKAFGGIAQ